MIFEDPFEKPFSYLKKTMGNSQSVCNDLLLRGEINMVLRWVVAREISRKDRLNLRLACRGLAQIFEIPTVTHLMTGVGGNFSTYIEEHVGLHHVVSHLVQHKRWVQFGHFIRTSGVDPREIMKNIHGGLGNNYNPKSKNYQKLLRNVLLPLARRLPKPDRRTPCTIISFERFGAYASVKHLDDFCALINFAMHTKDNYNACIEIGSMIRRLMMESQTDAVIHIYKTLGNKPVVGEHLLESFDSAVCDGECFPSKKMLSAIRDVIDFEQLNNDVKVNLILKSRTVKVAQWVSNNLVKIDPDTFSNFSSNNCSTFMGLNVCWSNPRMMVLWLMRTMNISLKSATTFDYVPSSILQIALHSDNVRIVKGVLQTLADLGTIQHDSFATYNILRKKSYYHIIASCRNDEMLAYLNE